MQEVIERVEALGLSAGASAASQAPDLMDLKRPHMLYILRETKGRYKSGVFKIGI